MRRFEEYIVSKRDPRLLFLNITSPRKLRDSIKGLTNSEVMFCYTIEILLYDHEISIRIWISNAIFFLTIVSYFINDMPADVKGFALLFEVDSKLNVPIRGNNRIKQIKKSIYDNYDLLLD